MRELQGVDRAGKEVGGERRRGREEVGQREEEEEGKGAEGVRRAWEREKKKYNEREERTRDRR